MRKKLLRSTSHLGDNLQGWGRREVRRECQSAPVTLEYLSPSIQCDALELHFLHPFSHDEFVEIKKLGTILDQQIVSGGLSLTFGSEPTFVDKMNSQDIEWNMTALSAKKRKIAFLLALALKKKWAQQGIMVYEHGKWCQSEFEPRWSLNIYWRKDGKPLFKNNENCALENDRKRYEIKDLKKIAMLLLKKCHCKGMPIKIYSEQSNEKIKRKNASKNKSKNEITNIGFLLPIIQDESKKWHRVKPMLRNNTKMIFKQSLHFSPSIYCGEEDRKIIEEMLRIELNKGKICVVMPKILNLESYLELLSIIEECAASLKYAILLQGFGPPENVLVKKLSITPDPGVLEVNCPPVQSFKECRILYQELFNQTKKQGLLPYKLNALGECQYTGGGHHITLGGRDKEHNPFLKKTHLLPSLITYWQHHPALSYLFSGKFIGSTSQAPRIDEGRTDNLYELEIALKELQNHKVPLDVEEIHKLLKNFLVDITGNAHRSEFCLDKFFNELSNGRILGLVELRAFEMQGHYQTNLLMILLVISLVNRFWQQSYDKPFKHFGMRLQDEFMLPQFIWHDLELVLIDLKSNGLNFDLNWFKSFFEMKFKHFGTIYYQHFWIEFRQALEFHPVLGEETTSGLNSRTIDPALNRIQIKTGGLNPSQIALLCNGYEVKLQPIPAKVPTLEEDANKENVADLNLENARSERISECNAEYIAGIRYKNSAPYFTAHPSIPVQTPILFECLDKKSNQIVLAFTFDPNADNDQIEQSAEEGIINKHKNHKESIIQLKKKYFNIQHGSNQNRSKFNKEIKQPIMYAEYPYTLDLRKNL